MTGRTENATGIPGARGKAGGPGPAGLRPRPEAISLKHLRTFMAVVAHGRFSEAGKHLRRAPSAISRSIDMLEEQFDCELLHRLNDGIVPTPAGERLALRCGRIHDELDECRQKLREIEVGPIRETAALFDMQVDTSRLEALVAVAHGGSAQRAADILSLSQPAISSAIRQLEADLGTDLFLRQKSGMVATPAGQVAVVCARRILAEMRRAGDDIASLDGSPRGLVCVGGLAYSRTALLPEVISRLSRECPELSIRTMESPIDYLVADLKAGDVDFLVGARLNPPLSDDLTIDPIVSDPMGLFVSASHPLATRRNLALDEVLGFPFILPPRGTATRRLLDQTFADSGAPPPSGRVECSSFAIIRNLLLSSGHVAFRSLTEFRWEMEAGRIVPLDVNRPLPVRVICLMAKARSIPTPGAQRFAAMVREVAQDVGRRPAPRPACEKTPPPPA